MIETYKFRLYPNDEQKVLLAKHFGTVRFVYNWALDFNTKQYAQTKRHLGWMSICTSDEYHQLKKRQSLDERSQYSKYGNYILNFFTIFTLD